MSDFDAMSESELLDVLRAKRQFVRALRKEILEIQQAHSTKALARKAAEHETAMNTPGAIMAQIEGVAAAAGAGAEAP